MLMQSDRIATYFKLLTDQNFWGFITLKFENGKLVHIRKEQNFKPDELPMLNALTWNIRRDIYGTSTSR